MITTREPYGPKLTKSQQILGTHTINHMVEKVNQKEEFVVEKSMDELCSFLEAKVNMFDEKGADYMGILAQNAELNWVDFFSSAEFEDFQRSI